VKCCDEHVCLSVSPLAYLKNHMAKLHEIFCTLPVAMARSSSGNTAICYVFRFLWMMSRFVIMGRMALGSINVGTLLQEVVINLQRIHQGVPRSLTLSLYTVSASCTSVAMSALCNCLYFLYDVYYVLLCTGIGAPT